VSVLRHRFSGTIHGFLWMAGALVDDFRTLMADLSADVQTLVHTRP
jgi:hypothetical protein